MIRIRTLALVSIVLFAASAFAQSEWGRASGGSIEMIAKAPHAFSGSLGLTQSSGLFPGRGYEGSLGGEILKDKVWFFSSASILPAARLDAIDAKATAQPVDWTHLGASFTQTPQTNAMTIPSTFLALRATSMLSDRMILSVSVSQQRAQ